MFLEKTALGVSMIATIALGCGSDGARPNATASSTSALTASPSKAASARAGLLAQFSASPPATSATVPPNGDVNPYEMSVDSASGSAFGLALEERGDDLRFTAVDDGMNVLAVWRVE
jgi:hypothetical protein